MTGYILNEIIIIILIFGVFFWYFFAFPDYITPKIILPTLTLILIISFSLGFFLISVILLFLLIFLTIFFIFKSFIFPKIRIPSFNWNSFVFKLKLYLVFSALIIIILLLLFHVIVIRLCFQKNYKTNLMFTLFNSLLFGVFLAVLGMFNKGIQKNIIIYILLFVLICCFLSGIGFLDFKITFNIWFFHKVYRTYSSGGVETGNFMLYNIVFFISLIVISFLIAKKKGVDK